MATIPYVWSSTSGVLHIMEKVLGSLPGQPSEWKSVCGKMFATKNVRPSTRKEVNGKSICKNCSKYYIPNIHDS